MDNRYIRLGFTNAKLFPKNTKSKDVVSNLNVNSKGDLIFKHSKRGEETISSFKEPITVYQISNMLHTLVGERPIPSFRYVFYEKDESIFGLALNSFIRYKTPKRIVKKNDTEIEEFINETTRINKAAWDSFSEPSSIQWFKIEKFLDSSYDDFISLLNQILGYDVTKNKFMDLSNLYSKKGDELKPVFDLLSKNKKTPIINFLKKDKISLSEITKSYGLYETINFGVDSVNILDGDILIPYDEAFVSRIIKNTTNILDGGFVEIIGVFYEYELYDIDGFIPVKTISNEKI